MRQRDPGSSLAGSPCIGLQLGTTPQTLNAKPNSKHNTDTDTDTALDHNAKPDLDLKLKPNPIHKVVRAVGALLRMAVGYRFVFRFGFTIISIILYQIKPYIPNCSLRLIFYVNALALPPTLTLALIAPNPDPRINRPQP